MAHIDKKTLEHLAQLSRMELSEAESNQLLGDLEKIFVHFEELKALETDAVLAVNGGTDLKNVTREDESERKALSRDLATKQFPKTKNGYLEVPHVFDTVENMNDK